MTTNSHANPEQASSTSTHSTAAASNTQDQQRLTQQDSNAIQSLSPLTPPPPLRQSHQIVALQRAVGNQTILRMLSRQAQAAHKPTNIIQHSPFIQRIGDDDTPIPVRDKDGNEKQIPAKDVPKNIFILLSDVGN